MLKGTSPSAELQQIAEGVPAGTAFTIGAAEAAKTTGASSAFLAADISDHIAVYRAADGARIFALAIPSHIANEQAFMLSPDANQLAVLAGEEIAFYEMPNSGKRR